MNVHRFAVATALATFLLLVIGGLVSTKEAGLACGNDWPTCEGSYFPKLIDGKEIEHSHRLVAMLVGTMTYGLCALLFKYRRRDRTLTSLGVLAVCLVLVQALLGRLTVKMALPADWTAEVCKPDAGGLAANGEMANAYSTKLTNPSPLKSAWSST